MHIKYLSIYFVLVQHLQAQKQIEQLIYDIEYKDKLGRTTSTFKSLHKFLEEDMSHLIIPSMREAKEMDRFRQETLFEAIPELDIPELRDAYDNAEVLERDEVEHQQPGNFAVGEGTVHE